MKSHRQAYRSLPEGLAVSPKCNPRLKTQAALQKAVCKLICVLSRAARFLKKPVICSASDRADYSL
jgi:hypothetical protein